MTRIEAITAPVLADASRHDTMYAGRTTVWHRWGEGRPIALLHGGSGSWTHWLRNVLPLANAGFMVFTPDIPGFGASEVAELQGNDAVGTVTPLWDGLQQLIQSPVPLVGFSFGAMVAVMMATARPACASQLVLLAPPGLGLRQESDKLVSWRGLVGDDARDHAHRHNLAVRMLHRKTSIDDEAVAVHSANLALDRMRGRRLHLTDVVLRALPQLNCPVAAVFGAQDALYRSQLGEAERRLQTASGFHSFHLIPDAGHWVQFEEPERTNAEIIRLLA